MSLEVIVNTCDIPVPVLGATTPLGACELAVKVV